MSIWDDKGEWLSRCREIIVCISAVSPGVKLAMPKLITAGLRTVDIPWLNCPIDQSSGPFGFCPLSRSGQVLRGDTHPTVKESFVEVIIKV